MNWPCPWATSSPTAPLNFSARKGSSTTTTRPVLSRAPLQYAYPLPLPTAVSPLKNKRVCLTHPARHSSARLREHDHCSGLLPHGG
jgi:hypothetical protein